MENKYDEVMERIQRWYVLDEPPVVTEEVIREFERELGHNLLADYRHFLTKYAFSAGEPYTCYGDVQHHGQPVWENGVGVFYGLGGETQHDLRDHLRFWRKLAWGESGLPRHLLPIAQADLGEICLSLAGPDAGRIYRWLSPAHQVDDPEYDERLVAHDFDTFIRSLQRRDDLEESSWTTNTTR